MLQTAIIVCLHCATCEESGIFTQCNDCLWYCSSKALNITALVSLHVLHVHTAEVLNCVTYSYSCIDTMQHMETIVMLQCATYGYTSVAALCSVWLHKCCYTVLNIAKWVLCVADKLHECCHTMLHKAPAMLLYHRTLVTVVLLYSIKYDFNSVVTLMCNWAGTDTEHTKWTLSIPVNESCAYL